MKSLAVPGVLVATEAGRMALTALQTLQLEKAERLERSDVLADRRAARAIRIEVEAELNAHAVSKVVHRGVSEAISLEVARGGEVDRRPAVGACRMKDRDGLRSLYELGRIDQAAYEMGLRYRRLYEAGSEMSRSQLEPSVGGGAVDHVGMGMKRAKAGAARIQIDIAVARDLRCPVALQTLRLVAGEGRSVRSLAVGRAFDRHVDALSSALRIAARVDERNES